MNAYNTNPEGNTNPPKIFGIAGFPVTADKAGVPPDTISFMRAPNDNIKPART